MTGPGCSEIGLALGFHYSRAAGVDRFPYYMEANPIPCSSSFPYTSHVHSHTFSHNNDERPIAFYNDFRNGRITTNGGRSVKRSDYLNDPYEVFQRFIRSSQPKTLLDGSHFTFPSVKGKTQDPTDVYTNEHSTGEVCGIYFFLSDCTTKNMAKLLPTQ
ncbi:hypothetical protein QTP88_024864 [Uroleucon formosanum]